MRTLRSWVIKNVGTPAECDAQRSGGLGNSIVRALFGSETAALDLMKAYPDAAAHAVSSASSSIARPRGAIGFAQALAVVRRGHFVEFQIEPCGPDAPHLALR